MYVNVSNIDIVSAVHQARCEGLRRSRRQSRRVSVSRPGDPLAGGAASLPS